MLTLRAAALLFVVDAAWLVWAGWATFGAVTEPDGSPPNWILAAGRLVLAAGLWSRARWAWWASVLIAGVLTLGTALAVTMIRLGGGFSGPHAPVFARAAAAALALDFAALVLLLLPPTRRALRPRHRPAA